MVVIVAVVIMMVDGRTKEVKMMGAPTKVMMMGGLRNVSFQQIHRSVKCWFSSKHSRKQNGCFQKHLRRCKCLFVGRLSERGIVGLLQQILRKRNETNAK